MTDHLPATRADLAARGWDSIDVLLVTGDAHVDHPSFPAALIGRVLESCGFRVAVLARPRIGDVEAVRALGRPRLFAGVTAGALDSMVANYTALRKPRRDDPHAPDGLAGGRPDRALTVYCNLLRQAFGKQVFIVAGGLEASLRRLAHYDYWSNRVRRPILMDCGADVAVWGMGENPVVAIARRLDAAAREQRNPPRSSLKDLLVDIPGVIWRQPASSPPPPGATELPSAEAVAEDPRQHLRAHQMMQEQRDSGCPPIYQVSGGMRVVVNPPPSSPATDQMDAYYQLPFTRDAHPMYGGRPIPALQQVRFSVTSHRGCAGGCAFCALTAHQGRGVSSRSGKSVLEEIQTIAAHPEFRGTVNDIGGPTANMWGARCTRAEPCGRASCLWPSRCAHFADEQEAYRELLQRAAQVPGVRHLFVTTGIRLDLMGSQPNLFEDIVLKHTSGHLKVAPEHVVPGVLQAMRKPANATFEKFLATHNRLAQGGRRRQFVVPYLMAAHPGCSLDDMIELARFLKRRNIRAEQCQIFTPTPGTDATVMYATGLDPATGAPIFVERTEAGKQLQKAMILWHKKEARPAMRKALQRAGRMDLAKELL